MFSVVFRTKSAITVYLCLGLALPLLGKAPQLNFNIVAIQKDRETLIGSTKLIAKRQLQRSMTHRAAFAYKGQTAWIELSDKGEVIQYQIPTTYAELPYQIKSYLRLHHIPANSAALWKIIRHNQPVYYEVEFEHKRMQINLSGKLM